MWCFFDKRIVILETLITQLFNWHDYTTNKADIDKIKNLWKKLILIFSQGRSNRFENYFLKLGKRIHQGKY